MRKLLFAALAIIISTNALPQGKRIDSLSSLISKTNDDNEKGRLLLSRSKAYPNRQLEKPMADAQLALSYFQQLNDPNGQVDAYLQLSGLYSRQSKYRLALDFDSTAWAIAKKNNYTKGAALALSLMGRNQQQLGDLVSAEQNGLMALEQLKLAGLESEVAEVHNRLGVIYRRLSNINRSLAHFDEAIAISKKYKKESVLAVSYMNKANSLNEAARYDEAINMHLQSIQIKERLNDDRGLMQSFNNIALVYMRIKEMPASIEYFRKAQRLAKQFDNKTALGYNNVNMATAYIHLRQLDSVEYFFDQSLKHFNATAEKPALALVYHNYGKFLLDQSRLQEALSLMEKALEIRRVMKSPYDIASTLNIIGSTLTRLGRHKEAEKHLLESMALLREENSVREKEVLQSLASHYKSIGRFEEAFEYQAGYVGMNDTLVRESEVANMLKAQSRYEVEKRDAQLKLAAKENELQTVVVKQKDQQLLFSFVALALALLLAAAFFITYRQKRSHALALEKNNAQIETLIRELHHRVKNNLQVVSGLLSLQSSKLDDETARQAMDEGRSRVDAMAMIHQKLYMDKDLAAVDMADYLKNLSESLANSFGYGRGHVQTKISLPATTLDIDRAIPIGLIVNELVTNAFKHAFKSNPDPRVKISLEEELTGAMILKVSDNGLGMDTVNRHSNSFGMKLVHTLVRQLNASIDMKQENGTIYNIRIGAS